ncbi:MULTISPECIES: hypothetical protein [unclassified Flavobacterium]|uniref:hypothetical protein n=1 Tax=unclassified Flavobacterium TaxID=196869 RepID=UPI001F13771C|nr:MULTISPECIES: hypothetical protein [unclassified Flavobacterium]UMY65132.1 hypothetical protein MKO97_11515 [Flavobacterium sp. HJ-32-4]
MTRLYLTFLLTCFLGSHAQEVVTFKDKSLPATPEWSFICETYVLGGQCDVRVARTETGGLLRLSLPVATAEHYIGGTVYIYLTDNTVITCTDKGLREAGDKRAVSWYVFTAKEMERLKKADIQFLRFVIRGSQRPFTGQTGFFTAENRKSYFGTFGDKAPNRFATGEAVKTLYSTP